VRERERERGADGHGTRKERFLEEKRVEEMGEDLTVWLCKQSPVLCVNDIFNISHRRLLKVLPSVSTFSKIL
jgi:hypothetical protein